MDAYQSKLINQVEQGILQVAEEEERKLDAKLKSLENLGIITMQVSFTCNTGLYSDEDDFEALRQKRRQALLKQTRQEQDWRQLGHGV